MTTATMADIGERLKKSRESRSLTIDQVQKQTRIHSSVLIALEEGRCDKMLTPTYVKSFLKKYASHLGLDIKDTMGEYMTAHPEARAQAEFQLKQGPEPGAKRPAVLSAIARRSPQVIFAVVIFMVVVYAGGRIIKFFTGRPRVNIVVSRKAAEVKAGKARTAKARPSAKPAAAAKETVKPEAAASKSEPLNLMIRAKRGVFVGASSDGKTVFKKHLPKGAAESIKADTSINLYMERGDSVELTLNGKTINPSRKGLIKDLEITRKGVRIK